MGVDREHSLKNVVFCVNCCFLFLTAHHYSILVLFKPIIFPHFFLYQGKLIRYRTFQRDDAGFFQSTGIPEEVAEPLASNYSEILLYNMIVVSSLCLGTCE